MTSLLSLGIKASCTAHSQDHVGDSEDSSDGSPIEPDASARTNDSETDTGKGADTTTTAPITVGGTKVRVYQLPAIFDRRRKG
jgi:hypothetical protein